MAEKKDPKNHLQIYVAVPLRNGRDIELSRKIIKLIQDLGHNVISDWLLLSDPNPGLSPSGIYERDYKAISSCDLILAEVSNPSIGIGMEIVLGKYLGKKIICIHKKENKVSNLLLGTPKIIILSYSDENNLKKVLQKYL